MSVFRIEKSKNYTAMSNYHLQDINLSLKACGLLSKMLALPENWDYSQAGLAKICKDGEDSISSTLKELEKNGYLVRERTRDQNGRMSSMLYHVYEIPKHILDANGGKVPEPPIRTKKARAGKRATSIQAPAPEPAPQPDLPGRENPVVVKPVVDNPGVDIPSQAVPAQVIPSQEFPVGGNQGQLNNNISKTYEGNTYGENTYQENTYNSSFSINPSVEQGRRGENGWMDQRVLSERDLSNWANRLKTQFNYDYFLTKAQQLSDQLDQDEISLEYFEEEFKGCNPRLLDNVVDYLSEFMASSSTLPVRVGQNMVARDLVKKRIMSADMFKVRDIIKQLSSAEIKNPKAYVISMVYNP